MSNDVLVEIPTKNRDAILAQTFAGFINQTFQDFDVLVINDGEEEVGRCKMTKLMLEILRNRRNVEVIEGSHISQAHNHNIPLFDPKYRQYQIIVRWDDDIIPNRRNLEYMVDAIRTLKADAIGGLWFEHEWISDEIHDRATITWDMRKRVETDGLVAVVNNNIQQRMYHPTDDLYEVQHIYSACAYRAQDMRDVGGWPEVYSPGVAHGEETDGCYRLRLSGCCLLIDPRITGQHLKSPGGIRQDKAVNEKQYADRIKWESRFPKLDEISFSPTVAVWCEHADGIGGAQRLFYETIHVLQQEYSPDFVYPIFSGAHYSPERAAELFGVSYVDHEEKPDEYDICLVMAHQPFKPVRAKKYVLMVFYPDETELSFDGFDLVLGISDFTCKGIRDAWGIIAHTLYPCVREIGMDSRQKKDQILLVCRADPYKAPLLLLEWFDSFRNLLPGWELHYVMATVDVYTSYADQIRQYAAAHEGIFIHEDVPDAQLYQLYRDSKVLWSANGLYAENKPKLCEHFGLTIVEAQSASCVPVVFDAGGHKETVMVEFRWTTKEELLQKTLVAAESECKRFVSLMEDYGYLLCGWLCRVNGMALELQRAPNIVIDERPIKVALICDSPYMPEYGMGLTTGFGVVGGQLLQRFVKQKDFDVSVFGLMDPRLPRQNLPWHFFPAPDRDMQGQDRKTLPKFMAWAENPDVVIDIYDPGDMYDHVQILGVLGNTQPFIGYFPVEGAGRISKATYDLVDSIRYPVVFSKCGADLVERSMPGRHIQWANLGIDHANFCFPDPEKRKRLRELVGWDDKFILFNVGTNKRGKQQPILIEAMTQLLLDGYEDIYMYLHTLPFDHHIMTGWDLEWIILSEEREYNVPVSKHILFPSMFHKWYGPKYNDDLDIWKMSTPPEPKQRGAFFNALDMVTRYQMADMYVDAASVEGFGLCLHPDSQIVTRSGLVAIKDITVGTDVMSHTGKWRRIVAKSERYSGAIKIECDYAHSLVVTDEHPLLALRRGIGEHKRFTKMKSARNFELAWIKAADLQVGDILVTPRPDKVPIRMSIDLLKYAGANVRLSSDGNHFTSSFSNIGTGQEVSLSDIADQAGFCTELCSRVVRKYGSVGDNARKKIADLVEKTNYTSNKKWCVRSIDVDAVFAELLGWYVAEGCVGKKNRRIEFCLGDHEPDDIFWIRSAIRNIFGVDTKVRKRKNSHGMIIGFSLYAVSEMFEDLCGIGAHNKKVPDCIICADTDVQEAFIRGYTRGDGHCEKRYRRVAISTASKLLAEQIKFLLLSVGILSRLSYDKKGIYNVLSCGEDAIRWATIAHRFIDVSSRIGGSNWHDSKFFYFPIRNIIEDAYTGIVYNIQVEHDDSYVANYITVHNCPLEAAACGVPAISIWDDSVRADIHSKYCHMISPVAWDTWHVGTKLAIVGVDRLVEEIAYLYDHQEDRFSHLDAQSHIKEDLPWDSTANFFVDLVRRAYAVSRSSERAR